MNAGEDQDALGNGNATTDNDEQHENFANKTNEPDFYDPEADARDEAWVQKLRHGKQSDAILSCPLCFTTVCVECQQHDVYENQFRAMFTLNCKYVLLFSCSQCDSAFLLVSSVKLHVLIDTSYTHIYLNIYRIDTSQTVKHSAIGSVTGKRKRNTTSTQTAATEEQNYHPVLCAVCDTEIGVREIDAKNGVFHFYNVVASNS